MYKRPINIGISNSITRCLKIPFKLGVRNQIVGIRMSRGACNNSLIWGNPTKEWQRKEGFMQVCHRLRVID